MLECAHAHLRSPRGFDTALRRDARARPVAPARHLPGTAARVLLRQQDLEPGLSENATNCPSDCLAAPLKSYNNLKACTDVDAVRTASATAQVQQYVRDAAAAGQKVKVSGNRHYDQATSICTSGVVINSSQATIHSTGTFEGEDTVLVDAGVKLGDLSEWLHARGKSLGYALMGFRLPTIGGAVATARRQVAEVGLGAREPRALDRAGDSAGNLRTFSKGTTPATQWRALTANAGMVGMVTRLRLAIEPQFRLRVKVPTTTRPRSSRAAVRSRR